MLVTMTKLKGPNSCQISKRQRLCTSLQNIFESISLQLFKLSSLLSMKKLKILLFNIQSIYLTQVVVTFLLVLLLLLETIEYKCLYADQRTLKTINDNQHSVTTFESKKSKCSDDSHSGAKF